MKCFTLIRAAADVRPFSAGGGPEGEVDHEGQKKNRGETAAAGG